MAGARVETFLLEKGRVAGFGRGQRNFHALYEVLAGSPACARQRAAAAPSAADDLYFLWDDATRRERGAGGAGAAAGSTGGAAPPPNTYAPSEAGQGFERLQAAWRLSPA